jgi:hypothetical protein
MTATRFPYLVIDGLFVRSRGPLRACNCQLNSDEEQGLTAAPDRGGISFPRDPPSSRSRSRTRGSVEGLPSRQTRLVAQSRGRRDGEKTAAPAAAATLGSVGAVS